MSEVKFCYISDLINKKFIKKFIDEIRDELIVFMLNGEIKAYTSVCPHMAGEINLINSALVCKWHGLKFSVDGVCEQFNHKIKLTEYLVQIRNDEVYICYEP